jgi:hypothetical protein
MTQWAHRACALVAVATLACNSIAGINDPVDPPGTSGGTPDAGTSGDGGVEVSGIDRFVGTWRNTKQVTAVCGNAPTATPPAELDLELRIAKSDVGLVLTLVQFPDCSLTFTVSGDVATASPNQECTFALTTGTLRYSYLTTSTFTLEPGAPAQAYLAAVVTPVGGSGSCDYEEASLYQKE